TLSRAEACCSCRVDQMHPVTVRNYVPCYVLVQIDRGSDTKNVIGKLGTWILAPMLTHTRAPRDGKSGAKWHTIAECSFKSLTCTITESGVVKLKRTAKDQTAVKCVAAIEFIFDVFGISEIIRRAIRGDRHADRAAVSKHMARDQDCHSRRQ